MTKIKDKKELLEKKERLEEQLEEIEIQLNSSDTDIVNQFNELVKTFETELSKIKNKDRQFFSPEEIELSEKYGVPLFEEDGDNRHHYIPKMFFETKKELLNLSWEYQTKLDIDRYAFDKDWGWQTSSSNC